jgi:hypothetical protein
VTQDADQMAQDVADMLKPELFEPAIRKAADDFYDQLLTGVQDYLRDNVAYNMAVHIRGLEGMVKTMRPAFTACHDAGISNEALDAGVIAKMVEALGDLLEHVAKYEPIKAQCAGEYSKPVFNAIEALALINGQTT